MEALSTNAEGTITTDPFGTDTSTEHSIISTPKTSTTTKSKITASTVVDFKDGEYHSGAATVHEISEGYTDGELSEECLVYVVDAWIDIREFLKHFVGDVDDVPVPSPEVSTSRHHSDVVTDTTVPPTNTIAKSVSASTMFNFKDGEYHSGAATHHEISEGYEEGELSEQCVVYVVDEWMDVQDFLKSHTVNEQNGPANITNVFIPADNNDTNKRDETCSPSSIDARTSVIPSSSSQPEIVKAASPNPAVGVVTKSAAKKPARDSSTWGTYSTPSTSLQNGADAAHQPLGDAVDAALLKRVDISKESNDSTVDKGEDDTGLPLFSDASLFDDDNDPNNGGKDSDGSEKEGILTSSSTANYQLISSIPPIPSVHQHRKKLLNPPKKMMRLIHQALLHHEMIKPNDALLLGLSGGKDSLTLLHCLLFLQKKLPTPFTIQVCTIDPSTPSFDPSPLIPYVESLGLKYHYIKQNIVERANTSGENGGVVSSLCAYCARMKRGLLYATARKAQCNKLVLAQHLDDCAESMMMSIMHNGFLRTMKANYVINDASVNLSVIRPLVYCRESLMTQFANDEGLPVINENCPACFEEPKERARMKKLLTREEALYPNLYDNIRKAMIPLMHEDSTSIIRCYTEEALAKSRKEQPSSNKGKPTSGKPRKTKREKMKEKHDRKKHYQQQNIVKDEQKTHHDDCNHELVNGNRETTSSTNMNGHHQQNADDDSMPLQDSYIAEASLVSLSNASDEQIVAELARRKAMKYKLHGSMLKSSDKLTSDYQVTKSNITSKNNADCDTMKSDPQMCSIQGNADGTIIPCYELME